MKRPESQANHERARDRYRRAETRSSFDERAKAKRHEQNLQPAIRSNSRDRFLHDFELTCLHRNIVEIHRSQHDPRNFQNSIRHAIRKG